MFLKTGNLENRKDGSRLMTLEYGMNDLHGSSLPFANDTFSFDLFRCLVFIRGSLMKIS